MTVETMTVVNVITVIDGESIIRKPYPQRVIIKDMKDTRDVRNVGEMFYNVEFVEWAKKEYGLTYWGSSDSDWKRAWRAYCFYSGLKSNI